jgi:hypothetical protein
LFFYGNTKQNYTNWLQIVNDFFEIIFFLIAKNQ